MDKVEIKTVTKGLAAAFGVQIGDTVKVLPAHAKLLISKGDAEEIEPSGEKEEKAKHDDKSDKNAGKRQTKQEKV